MLYIIDTYAWVGYLIGSKKGETLRKLFDSTSNNFITLECCLAEINGWCIKNKLNFENIYSVIRSNSEIRSALTEDWIRAARIRFEMRKKIKNFGLIDSIILIKQMEYDCKIVSGDLHFKNLKNVVYVGD